MMTYEEFLGYVKEHVLDGMEGKEEMTAVIKETRKNNNIVLKTLVVARNETDIFPNVYLDDYYLEYCLSKKSIDEILKEIRENHLTEEVKEFLPFDMESLKEENVVGCLVSLHNNEEFLKDLPFIPVGDFAIIFKYYIEELPDGEEGTLLITDGMAERKGYTRGKLLELAIANSPKHFPVKMYGMEEILLEMLKESMLDMLKASGMSTDIWYLTNEKEYDGAFSLLYPETKEMLLEKFDGNIILLPVSTNVLILISEDQKDRFGDLEQLIARENEKMLQKENILGEKPYLLKREDLEREEMLLQLLTPVSNG